MFQNKFKVLTTLLIAILMVSVSANVIAFNADSSKGTRSDAVVKDNIDEPDTQPDEQTIEISVEDLPIERVNPSEIIAEFPELMNPLEAYPGKYLEGQDIKPIGRRVDTFDNTIVPSPDELLRMAAGVASKPEFHDYSSSDDSASSTRGSRADAGDTPGEATELTDGGKWIGDKVECHVGGSPPQYHQDDIDWFRVLVREYGAIQTEYMELKVENTAPPDPTNTFDREVYCFMFEPLSVAINNSIYGQTNYPIPGPLENKVMSPDDSDISQYYIDLEIVPPGENRTLNAAPPISSYFYILLACWSDIDLNYNITSVSITKKSAIDNNNYPDNATTPTGKDSVKGQEVTQHLDHWDWYDLSGFIEYIGPTWPNKISYTIDITDEERGPGNDHSWVTAWVLYDSEDGNKLYLNGDERNTGGSKSRTGTDPIQHSFEMDGSHAWLGLRVRSMRVNSQGDYLFLTFNGRAEYDLNFNIEVKNFYPILSGAKLEPPQPYYFLEDDLTFKIRYKDLDDNAPTYMRVTIDGTNYDMSSTSSNWDGGVDFSAQFKGNDFGISPYPHEFNYSACDGLDAVEFSLPDPNNKFKIIENQTPKIYESAPEVIALDEDDEIQLIAFSQIFEDLDKSDGMDFYIKSGESWGKKYTSSTMEVFVTGNNLKIVLKANQHGYDVVKLKAEESLTRDADEYSFSTTHTVNITVAAVNDKPLLDTIPVIQGDEDYNIRVPIKATDPDIITDDDTMTFSTNRSDGVGADDLEGFVLTVDETDFTKANITFTPLNEHVGSFLVKVIAKDKQGAEDSLDVEFKIINTNDPPVITEVATDITKEIIEADTTEVEFTGKKYSAVEDEWFNISVKIYDPDIYIGETNDIEFKILNSTFLSPVDIEHSGPSDLTAVISLLPGNSDVGENEINLYVHDGKGGSDEVKIIINTRNVNDPPKEPEITSPADQNSTFSIVDRITFEGWSDDQDFYVFNSEEELTYIWEWTYADGSATYQELYRGHTNSSEKFSFKIKPIDRFFKEGQYNIKLTVQDIEKEERFTDIIVTLSEDFDGDNIPDAWEDKYDLNPHNRRDALEDLDTDGYSNYKEYLGKDGLPGGDDDTNPYDISDYPGTKKSATDYSLVIYAAIVVVVIIVLLLLFMFIKKRRKAKSEEVDLDKLAYPPEEETEMQLAKSLGLPPPGGPGGPGAMPPGMPPQFMMMNEMQRMQMMKMMQQMQTQMQAQSQVPGKDQQGVGASAGKGTEIQKSQNITEGKLDAGGLSGGTANEPQLDSVSMKPQLPPASTNGNKKESTIGVDSTTEGRHSPIDSISDDELGKMDVIEQMEATSDSTGPMLLKGEPGFMSDSEVQALGIIEPEVAKDDLEEEGDNGPDEMKCPNCGVSVKNGWFLCPACQSPLH